STTASPVRSLTSSSAPSEATATGLASRGLVTLRATPSLPSNATSRLCSGSGAQDRPPNDAAGERRRNRRVRLLEGGAEGAGDPQARSAAATGSAHRTNTAVVALIRLTIVQSSGDRYSE